MAASLQRLPPPLLGLILSYISDPETICNAAATCKDFRTATLDAALWGKLHQDRWAACPSSCLTKTNYEERHRLDASALKCIDCLQTSTNHLAMLYAVTHIMSSGTKILDAVWKVWRQNDDEDNKIRDTASSLVHLLHYQSVCESLMEILANDKEGHHDDEKHFEECAILTSKMFFHLDKDNLLCADTESHFIRTELDRIAATIQSQFQLPHHMHLEDKLCVMHKVLFRELQFSSNNEYDDNTSDHHCANSLLLHRSLKQRQAINPLTLSILYKCICRRVGIKVEIGLLPGNNLVSLPELNRIVDVADNGRLLSFHDCELRFRAHRFPITRSSALKPKSTQLVIQRILKYIDDSLDKNSSENETAPPPPRLIGDDGMKRAAVTALRALACRPDTERMESCRRLLGLTWVTEFAKKL